MKNFVWRYFKFIFVLFNSQENTNFHINENFYPILPNAADSLAKGAALVAIPNFNSQRK